MKPLSPHRLLSILLTISVIFNLFLLLQIQPPCKIETCEDRVEPSVKHRFLENPLLTNKKFYDEKYWAYQEGLGAFGGKAEAFKFRELIRETDTLIDYGGGGGFLLNNLRADRKILIEPNPHARKVAREKFSLETYAMVEDTPQTLRADIIITNHCLEHVPNPLEELTKLRQMLKPGGKLCIVVPVDAALGAPYNKNDINHHIYTWNALLLGNLVTDAGFEIIQSEEISYQWPPDFEGIWNRLGEDGFLKVAHEYALKNNNKQVRLLATVRSDS